MINVTFEPQNNRAAAYDGEKLIGESDYSASEGLWIISHTGVNPEYREQGVASKLVALLVDEARKSSIKINPLCPFARHEFDTIEAYADVRQ